MIKKTIVLLFALIVFVAGLSAKPARRDAITLEQPDGAQLTAYLHGDAFFHYYTDTEGNMLQLTADGYYRPTEMPSEEELLTMRMNNPRYIARQHMAGGELNLAPRGLIILVSFSDLAFKTSVAEMDSMINGLDYTRSYATKPQTGLFTTITSSGSARKYFRDNSFGQYNPVFDVVGPVTLSKGYAYYGSNDWRGNDQHVNEMIKEACQLVNSQVDFTRYDNDNDGKVDFVYVIYAGYSESDGAGDDYIWPHNYNLSYTGTNCVVDGKKVDNYACSNEIDSNSGKHDGIGTFCHEFSHVLGLPDLYATTDNATHKTLGMWDILDYGPYNNDGNTPPCYSAYERFYMGWLTPVVLNSACDVILPALADANCAVLLSSTGTHNMVGTNPNPSTFYLLENRQNTGWDAYLPGHGLLVTKISYSSYKWQSNAVNNTKTAMGVDIVEADGNAPSYNARNRSNGYFGKAGDAYPEGATSFTSLSAYKVTNISEENDTIYFQVNGGGKSILVLDVEATELPGTHSGRKYLRNGMILIEHNGTYYDLSGRKYDL